MAGSQRRLSIGSLLSKREHEVAKLVTTGMTNRQIATVLQIGEKTVETHLHRIFRKLDISSRAQLAVLVVSPADGPSVME